MNFGLLWGKNLCFIYLFELFLNFLLTTYRKCWNFDFEYERQVKFSKHEKDFETLVHAIRWCWKLKMATNNTYNFWQICMTLMHAMQVPTQSFGQLNPTWCKMLSINREAFCNCKHPNLREVESNCKWNDLRDLRELPLECSTEVLFWCIGVLDVESFFQIL